MLQNLEAVRASSANTTILKLPTRLCTYETVSKFDQVIVKNLNLGYSHLLLDCSKVECINSLGLRSLIAALRGARQIGGTVVLFAPTGSITLLLSLSNMHRMLPIFLDQSSALNFLAKS